jgi:twitching motility two-component system response regulator PilH
MATIRKILVIDDSAVERYHLTDMLTKKGYRVVEATDGEDGLLKAKMHSPDLVLMDVIMPGQNGFQITRQFSKDGELSHIPVIMCTSKDAETDRVWGMRQGAKGYLTKPIKADSLFAMIQSLSTEDASVKP